MIAVECYADTQLVRSLGVPKAKVNHARGKGHVLDVLKSRRAVVGLVDEDPGAVEYPELRNYRETARMGGLRLLEHVSDDGRCVVMICPRLEDWMLARAKSVGVNPAEFGLAAQPRALHSSGRYDRSLRFSLFLEKLLTADSEVKQLRTWLSQ